MQWLTLIVGHNLAMFFIAQGAISVAADADIKGTLFSKIAVGLGARTVLEGRMLS
jgi:hypothetical protein